MDSGDGVSVKRRGLVMHEPKKGMEADSNNNKKKALCSKNRSWTKFKKMQKPCKKGAKYSYKQKSHKRLLTE